MQRPPRPRPWNVFPAGTGSFEVRIGPARSRLKGKRVVLLLSLPLRIFEHTLQRVGRSSKLPSSWTFFNRSQTIQFEDGRKDDDLTGERKAALEYLLKGVTQRDRCVCSSWVFRYCTIPTDPATKASGQFGFEGLWLESRRVGGNGTLSFHVACRQGECFPAPF